MCNILPPAYVVNVDIYSTCSFGYKRSGAWFYNIHATKDIMNNEKIINEENFEFQQLDFNKEANGISFLLR